MKNKVDLPIFFYDSLSYEPVFIVETRRIDEIIFRLARWRISTMKTGSYLSGKRIFCIMCAIPTKGNDILQETTLAKAVEYQGIGLHSGKTVHMRLLPANEHSGITFVRTDLTERPHIRALAANVTSTLRATTIEENGVRVFTVEHLMSALHALKIDNCTIEMDAEEPPVTDGRASVFFDIIETAGTKELPVERREIAIAKPCRVDDGDGQRFIVALPSDTFRVSFTSLNPHPLVGIQYGNFVIDKATYRQEIAPARTIAYEGEVTALREMGLGLGGNLDNVIVYNDERWLNELRFNDELVRHKILDIIGDLRLAGIVRGHIIAVAAGHALNTRLAKLVANDFQNS